MTRALIFEPKVTGHYLTYVAAMIPAFLDRGIKVVLVLSATAEDSDAYHYKLSKFEQDIEVKFLLPAGRYKHDALNTLIWNKSLLALLENEEFEAIFVPGGDNFPLASLFTSRRRFRRALRGAPLAYGLVLFNLHGEAPTLKQKLINKIRVIALQKTYGDKLCINDPFAFDWLAREHQALSRKFALIPDPIEGFEPVSKLSARKILNMPVEGRYVGVVGALSTNPKKGLADFVNALSLLKDESDLHALFAGKMTNATLHLISSLKSVFGSRLVVIDRFLTDKELHIAVSSLDVVCTPNTGNIGVSGIVMRALQANRIVVGSNVGWQATAIPMLGLGSVVNVDDPQLFAKAIINASHLGEAAVNQKGARMLEYSSKMNFGQTWLDAVGLSSGTECLKWNHVIANSRS